MSTTKENAAKAETLQFNLNQRGLDVKVTFTKRGYIKLIIPAETMKNYRCIGAVQGRAAEILGCNPGDIYAVNE